MQTNNQIEIWETVKAWNGALTESIVGTYDVWLEYGEQYIYTTVSGVIVKQEIGKGMVILAEEIDLSNHFIKFAGIRYEINSPEVFRDRKGNFHHMEFMFK